MRYIFDEHTRERMEQRNISEAEIDAAIRKPDASEGVNLQALPARDTLSVLLEQQHIKVFA